MVSKRILCAAVLLSLLPVALIAQEAESASSAQSTAQNQNAEANQIVQRFTWEDMGDVLKYGIVI